MEKWRSNRRVMKSLTSHKVRTSTVVTVVSPPVIWIPGSDRVPFKFIS